LGFPAPRFTRTGGDPAGTPVRCEDGGRGEGRAAMDGRDEAGTLPRKVYEAELRRLQTELVTLLEWVRREGARLVVVFEGRDAAGKGSAVKPGTGDLHPPL